MSVVLTKSRALNALRCFASYALNRLGSVLNFIHLSPLTFRHSPLFVSVEPANICQLRCPACPVGLRNHEITRSRDHQKFLSLEIWSRTLSEVAKTAWTIQFYFQGEPLLNKHLPQMIREAHEAGLYTIVSTNAQAMTPQLADDLVTSGLDRIIISMDGLSEASYNAYRVGGSLQQCMHALSYLRAAKEKHHSPLIELQCLRLRSNEHEWTQFRREYKRLGADRLVFKTAQLYDYAEGHPLMPSNPRYSRYIQGADGLFHRKHLGRGCLRVWSGVVVTTNGEVLPCCYDKAHEYAYGNIMEKSLAELFQSEQANAFRQAALNEQPLICQECWK